MIPLPHGNERVVRFGADNVLVGIVTEAAASAQQPADPSRPAVILLNSGILHRVGSCRLHVKLARALSASGFHCLRFDYSGIGDSDQRRDVLSFQESAVLETREAMDRLQRLKGVNRFVLIGLCSGADMAHETAMVDDRVVGLHLIDGWSYRTAGFFLHHYAPRVLKLSAWTNALRVRLQLLVSALRPRDVDATESGVEYEMPTYTRVFPPRTRIASDLRRLVARGVQLRMLWTGGLADYNHLGQYASRFDDVPFGDALEEDYLPRADHILTDLDDQDSVTRRAVAWALRLWPARTNPVPPQLTASELTPDHAHSLFTLEIPMLRSALLPALVFALATAACAPSDTPTSPTAQVANASADLVGDANNEFSVVPGVVNVCAFFPTSAGVDVASASFLATGPAGQGVLAGEQTLIPVPHCLEVWNAVDTGTHAITAALQAHTAGYTLDRIVRTTGDGEGSVWTDLLYFGTTATVDVSNDIGGAIWFKFRDSTLPNVGGDGCTPGYWKQRQHRSSWPVPYTANTQFGTVFANAFPNKSLQQVLTNNGGGLNALGRHTVAALLNAASSGVDYDLSVAAVIAAFNTAYATGSRSLMIDQKNVFDMLNNQGCPLN